MTTSPDKAGQILKEGIFLIRAAYLAHGVDKSITTIEDELGYLIGKEGHTIRKWKSGNIPIATGFHEDFLREAETLTKKMIELSEPHQNWNWGERFLSSVGHPTPKAVCVAHGCEFNPAGEQRQPDKIQIEIVIKLNVPRDEFYRRIEKLLLRVKTLIGNADVFKVIGF